MKTHDYKRAAELFESLPDTTTILEALAMWLDEQGDRTGAQLIIDWRAEFAEYEHQ